MSLYCAIGSAERELSALELKELLTASLAKPGLTRRVIAVPPDHSRIHSRAGELTQFAWEYYGERLRAVLSRTWNPRGDAA